MKNPFLCAILVALSHSLTAGISPLLADTPADQPARIPVIIDTDIGDDIDDCWALVLALKNPHLDIKLVTTTYFKSEYRARLIAKYLTAANRTDIPIGLGPDDGTHKDQGMAKWIADFPLSNFKGVVLQDGPQAMVDTINHSPTPITVVAIGPLNTIGAALKKDPGIAAKAYLVGMQGSVYHGYGQNSKPAREYNVERDLPDAKAVLSAPWKNIAITPLDTCSVVCLAGDNFAQLKKSDDPLIKALLQNTMGDKITDPAQLTHSGTLFDDVAVYMADTTNNHSLLHYDRLKIAVADNGFTVISPQGVDMDVATTWTDRNGFYDYYLGMLLGHGP